MILRALVAIGIILAATVLSIGMVAALKKPSEKKPPTERRLLVDVTPVELSSLAMTVPSQGTVRPRTSTTLVAEAAGQVIEVADSFVAGGFFRKGDVLLTLDPRDYEVAIKQASASLAQAEAAKAQEQARSEQALKDWQQLGRSGKPSTLVLREPQLAEATARVDAAEADLLRAERDLEKTKVRAPYDGLLQSKQADVGRYVTPGTQLGTAFAVDSAEIRLPLSDADLAYLALPTFTNQDQWPEVTLSASIAGQPRQWRANIVRTEGVVDERSRVTYAVARLADPYGVFNADSAHTPLPIGTFVEADIDGIWAEQVALLPRHVLRDNNTVLLAGAENELEIRQVEVLRADAQRVYVSSGLNVGDRVITTAIDIPIPGLELTISNAAATSAVDAPESLLDASANDVDAAGDAPTLMRSQE